MIKFSRHIQKKWYDLTRQASSYHEQWFLRFAFCNNPLHWQEQTFFQIIPPAQHIYADPFVAHHAGRNFLIFEIDNHTKPKGYIGACEIFADGSYGEVRTVLNCDYHLSYPFIFLHENQWYMIPETSANHTIELWQAIDFPFSWQKKQILINHIEAVDTTLYFDGNIYYLLTSTKINSKKFGNRLDIFISDNLFSNHWLSHSNNPVKQNLLYERPAGNLFTVDGKLYRPVQDSIKRYGGAMEIRRVLEINRNNYQETTIMTIQPQQFGCIGTHTFSYANGILVMDALHQVK